MDAEATEIQLSIKNGGKDLIEVKDNGRGISVEDIPLSVKRHSTSKIQSEKDLNAIYTMGFRGEALYSIASVSRFTIISRTSEDELARKITVEGNVDDYQISEEILAAPGTIIRVQDLFFNYNVRRKFLKKASIEQSHIYNIIAQYAVANPEISFTYINENKAEFKTIKDNNHLSVIKEVFGRELADALFDIGIIQRGEIEIQGYLSRSGQHKKSRKYQFFYLNGRRIYSKLLQSSLEEGYGSYLMKGEFPITFLFIDIDPVNFDVNIHPQKREVLFYDEKTLRSAITSSVSYSLKAQNIVPQFTPKSNGRVQQTLDSLNIPSIESKENYKLKRQYNPDISSFKVHDTIGQSDLLSYSKEDQNKVISSKSTTYERLDLFNSHLKYRGQLGKEFLMFEDIATNDLILLDFHAAHERINLEKIRSMYKLRKIATQSFLKPFRFEITPEQLTKIKESIILIHNLGIDVRIPKNKDRMVEVHSIPRIIMKREIKPFLESIIENFSSLVINGQIDKVFSLIACHASYRAGDTISFRQAKEILTVLEQAENPTICAHGRPTYFRITYQEFLKQVRRI
ncbi:MAG: DNA mismatch repair endonuclease MutL [Candidatus Hodarchaeales archaeon]